MTPWVLLKFPPKNLEEWRLKIQIAVELLGGFIHIPKEEVQQFTPEELIGDMPYEYTASYSYFHIQSTKRKPQWNFGDPAPEKPKKHKAEYIWRALV